jgi:hypothetical protein
LFFDGKLTVRAIRNKQGENKIKRAKTELKKSWEAHEKVKKRSGP